MEPARDQRPHVPVRQVIAGPASNVDTNPGQLRHDEPVRVLPPQLLPEAIQRRRAPRAERAVPGNPHVPAQEFLDQRTPPREPELPAQGGQATLGSERLDPAGHVRLFVQPGRDRPEHPIEHGLTVDPRTPDAVKIGELVEAVIDRQGNTFLDRRRRVQGARGPHEINDATKHDGHERVGRVPLGLEATVHESLQVRHGMGHAGAGGILPNEFLNSQAIYVTTCQKLFNGKTKFGIHGNVIENVGALVLDDAHRSVEIIVDAFTIRIKRNENGDIYDGLIKFFFEALREQAPGTLLDIVEGWSTKIMMVPYWTWIDKKTQILTFLDGMRKNNDHIQFRWALLSNNIEHCYCLLSGNMIEITPRKTFINLFPSFTRAKRRIFMSATLSEDAFLIRDLEVESSAVLYPLSDENIPYSGERMIIIPSKVDPEVITKEAVINHLKGFTSRGFGIFVIIPSDYLYKKDWKHSHRVRDDLFDIIAHLKENQGFDKIYALINSYDGIDLPGNTCRILILDSLPAYDTLLNKFVNNVISDSEISIRRQIQRIEQGIGRGIRDTTDWCIAILLNADLTRFVSLERNLKYFSPEVREQINISEDLTKIIREGSDGGSWKKIEELMNQCINRDQNWRNLYRVRMRKVLPRPPTEILVRRFEKELQIDRLFMKQDYEGGIAELNGLINEACNDLNQEEKGWYFQLMANYIYIHNKLGANDLQIKAHECNSFLLKPVRGVVVNRRLLRDEGRERRILEYLANFVNKNQLLIELNSLKQNISFQSDYESFEHSFDEIAQFIGIESQRPEKKYGNGPDLLWALPGKEFWIIEAKNEVQNPPTRGVSKNEVGQVTNSIGWFIKEYESLYSSYTPIIIHPANYLDNSATPNQDIYVMTEELLNELKRRIELFISQVSFRGEIQEQNVRQALSACRLDRAGFDSLRTKLVKRTP